MLFRSSASQRPIDDLGKSIGRWDADGRNRAGLRIIAGPGNRHAFQMISFSPSGNRAALVTAHFRDICLATVRDDRLEVFASVPRGFDYVSQSVWRDDDHVLFVGRRGTDRQELWEITVSTGAVTKRGIDGLWLRDQLALSPDRQSVVVTAVADSETSHWNVWQYSLATQRKRRITQGTEDIVASWR